MLSFRCPRCQCAVFFENVACGGCGALLGFVVASRQMQAFEPPPDPASTAAWVPCAPGPQDDAQPLWPCANRAQHGVCNWMLDAGEAGALCCSCRLTQVIPALDVPGNLDRWQRMEQAKRRLVFTLLALDLQPEPKAGPDDPHGLAFHWLSTLPGQAGVKTGHDRGTVTVNIAEADDDAREAIRVRLREPSRTLLGHLRHEVSHYLQHRYVTGDAALARCREAFGDERQDYAAALQRHYDVGPPPDWSTRFISAYASAHPWEDWAETCAHYLLVVDAVQTAGAWGLSLQGGPARLLAGADTSSPHAPIEDMAIAQWLPVAQFLNAMNRSLGHRDAYPFLMPPPVVSKLAVVQALLSPAGVRSCS